MRNQQALLLLLASSVWWRPSHEQSGDGAAVCLYRDYPPATPAHFAHLAGWGCYTYGPSSRFRSTLRTHTCYGADSIAYPCAGYVDPETNETLTVDYDPYDEESRNVISASFAEIRFFDNWVTCCKGAETCCQRAVSDPGGEGYCPHTWDGWQCWDASSPQTTQQMPCPNYVYTSEPPTCTYYATKECFKNGTWFVTTNFEGCNIVPVTKSRIIFHIAVLGVSAVSVFPAILISFCYKKLRVLRVTLHRNLMCAVVLRNILTLSIKAGIVLEALLAVDGEDTTMEGNSVGCRILAVSEKLSGNAVFACMLLESIFLHRLIAAAMRGVPRMKYYFIGAAVVACCPVLAWAISKALVDDTDCWVVDSSLQWINDGPRIALLSVNTILLMDIIRVLLTKLKHVTSARSGYIRRTTKATLMLAPVFGINILLTAYRPKPESCVAEQAYYFFSYTMEGLQGFIVALLYIYLNKEVQSLLHRTYVNLKIKIFDFFRCDKATERARQELHLLIRRMTLSTNADGWNPNTQESNINRVSTQANMLQMPSTPITDYPGSESNDGKLAVRTSNGPRRMTISFEEPTEVETVPTESDRNISQEDITSRVTITFKATTESSGI